MATDASSSDRASMSTYGASPEAIREEKRSIGRKIDRDFVRIAAPALVQFTAEPLASLVDTVYLGRLGTSRYSFMP